MILRGLEKERKKKDRTCKRLETPDKLPTSWFPIWDSKCWETTRAATPYKSHNHYSLCRQSSHTSIQLIAAAIRVSHSHGSSSNPPQKQVRRKNCPPQSRFQYPLQFTSELLILTATVSMCMSGAVQGCGLLKFACWYLTKGGAWAQGHREGQM